MNNRTTKIAFPRNNSKNYRFPDAREMHIGGEFIK